MSAARVFKVIESPTDRVTGPYGEGERIIAELGRGETQERPHLLKQAQCYSVNLFPYPVPQLKERLHEVWVGSCIYALDERHYSKVFGTCTDEVADMKPLIAWRRCE